MRHWPLPALVVLLVGAGWLRLGLIMREWPVSNSDEGTVGIMALHIAAGRNLPDFYYGQAYMGSTQAYLAGAIFKAFGPSLQALRIGLLLLHLAFLIALYALARRLYSTGVALATVGLLALGSRELYGSELVAIGGLPETLLAGTALLLIGHRLLSITGRSGPGRQRWTMAGWGVVAALGMWSDMLVAPFIVGSALLLWQARQRRRAAGLRLRRAGWALTAGLLVGATPFVVHDLTHSWRQNSLARLVVLYVAGGTGQGGRHSTGLMAQVVNTVSTSLAYATGGAGLAHHNDPSAWPTGWSGGWHPPVGNSVDTLWGLSLVVLWGIALSATVRALRRRPRTVGPTGVGEIGPTDTALWARLALLISAGLTVVLFAASQTPGISPANNSRYLIGLLIATPAIIAPLWPRRTYRRYALALGPLVVLVAAAILATGTADAYRDAGRATGEAVPRTLAQALLNRGVTRIYTDYWTCDRLIFDSRERVICAVLDRYPEGLYHGLDRYGPYRAAVLADPNAAYVFKRGTPDVDALATLSGCQWREQWQAAGYEIWQPTGLCVLRPDPRAKSRL